MRDFFLYAAFAAEETLFHLKGLPVTSRKKQNQMESSIQWTHPKQKPTQWTRWSTGKTQFPLIDAGMRELLTTGYCSNRVRQNIASFLTKDCKLDWRAGAEWFQFLLEDFCLGSNWGNWLYFSGVGPDPKQRHFRTVSQMKRYDASGKYVQKWIPELKDVDGNIEALFRPWDFDVLGFQDPIVDPISQFTWQDLKLLETNGKLLGDEK